MSIIPRKVRVEPPPPTMEEDMDGVLRERIKQYAPPQHADRISATSKIMCDAVRKVATDTGSSLDERVTELHARVKDVIAHVAVIEDGVSAFKQAMQTEAGALISKIEGVLANYEDIAAKLHQSPFNGESPKFLEKEESHDADGQTGS
jgi:hypothetical protein